MAYPMYDSCRCRPQKDYLQQSIEKKTNYFTSPSSSSAIINISTQAPSPCHLVTMDTNLCLYVNEARGQLASPGHYGYSWLTFSKWPWISRSALALITPSRLFSGCMEISLDIQLRRYFSQFMTPPCLWEMLGSLFLTSALSEHNTGILLLNIYSETESLNSHPGNSILSRFFDKS